jgi:hypothetical protein
MAIKSNMSSLKSRREVYKRDITLISKGYFAPTCFPEGKITVYPWDSLVDDWMAEHARKGHAQTMMFDLVEKLSNLNGCRIDDFLIGEVNLVLLVARSILDANVLILDLTCTHCQKKGQTKVSVPDELAKIGEKPIGYPGYDTITLLGSNDVVCVRPLTVGDDKFIDARDPLEKKIIGDSTARLLRAIRSINDTQPDDMQEAFEWYSALPPKDAADLSKFQRENVPHLSPVLEFQCDDCGKFFKQGLDFNREFFRHLGAPI